MTLNDLRLEFMKGNLSKAEYIERMHDFHKILFEYSELLKHTDIGKIEISDDMVSMTTRNNGIRFLVDKNDARIAPIEMLNFGFYEKKEMDMIARLVQNTQTVLDVGGNIGWFSLTLAKLRKDLNIYTFEPIPKTFDYLEQNVQLNHFGNIKCFNFGFSHCEGVIPFYYYSQGSENASMTNVSGKEDVCIQESKVMRMDDFVNKFNLTVDFIKCDVEGGELFVFQGGIETIKRDRPIIFTEMLRKWSEKFNYHPNDIINLLKEIGYICLVTSGTKLDEFAVVDDETIDTNFFFLHTINHSSLIDKLKIGD